MLGDRLVETIQAIMMYVVICTVAEGWLRWAWAWWPGEEVNDAP